MSPQPGLCAVRDHHRSPGPANQGVVLVATITQLHAPAASASQERRAVTKPYPSKVSLDGASAISAPPTNLRKKVEIVSGCRDGRALRASLRSRAWKRTTPLQPNTWLGGAARTHTLGTEVPSPRLQ